MTYSCQAEADFYEGHPEPEEEMPAPATDRDEELEQFIEAQTKGSSQNLWNGDDGFSVGQLRSACERVAAFASSRAREKAIDEFCHHLKHMVELETTMAGKDHLATQVLTLALEHFQSMKSL
jgi:hypothetical protein